MSGEIELDEKLKLLILSKPKDYLLSTIRKYNEYCKENDLKEQIIKGFSKLKKEGLFDLIINQLSDEEKENIFLKKEDEFVRDLIVDGLKIVNGEDKVNKFVKKEKEGNTYNFYFKGFSWETKTSIEVDKKKNFEDYYCNCRISESGGFCSHLFASLIFLVRANELNIDSFLIKISPENMELINLSNPEEYFESLDDSDIFLYPDYKISVNGMKVTMAWGGEHAGDSTKDFSKVSATSTKKSKEKKAKKKKSKKKTKKKEVDVELWVAKKVVDKILAPLKRSGRSPRKLIKDKINIVDRIIREEKLVDKLLRAFKENQMFLQEKLPTSREELEHYLKANLK
ncbi:MAG: hypothetical protein ACTSVY_14515 [Candidatus Helarchaeota archaeon]